MTPSMIEPSRSSSPRTAMRAASALTSAPPEQLPARWKRSLPVIAVIASTASSTPAAYVSSVQSRCSSVGLRHDSANTCWPSRTSDSTRLRSGARSTR